MNQDAPTHHASTLGQKGNNHSDDPCEDQSKHMITGAPCISSVILKEQWPQDTCHFKRAVRVLQAFADQQTERSDSEE